MVKSYEDLIVWQKAMDMTEEVYRVTKQLPKEETFSLMDQMRRSAVSVPSNIAEGFGRKNQREFHRFLLIARGSAMELETQLKICLRVGYLQKEMITKILNLLSEINKIIFSILSPVS
ncbi:MAG: four helix bundle protein [Bacteroidales bacterium]|nr:four helix bundle protein [Bacteroidales bacterium]